MSTAEATGTVGSRRWKQLRRAHLRLGERGERLACKLLRQRGMAIIMRNYSGPHGEIDIIARDGAMLCFVEVKTRRRPGKSRPADAVTAKKKHNLIQTGRRYVRQLGNPPLVYRFDIVEIILDGRHLLEARHWPNAFTSEDIRYYQDTELRVADA